MRPKASHCLPAEDANAFQKIITGYQIDLIVSGHIHKYMEGTFAGVRLVHLPSSGQVIRDPGNPMYGYAMFDFADNGSIAVKQIDVTAETGRERMEFFASTVLGDKPPIFFAGLAMIVIGSALLSRHEFAPGRTSRPSFGTATIYSEGAGNQCQPAWLHSAKKRGSATYDTPPAPPPVG